MQRANFVEFNRITVVVDNAGIYARQRPTTNASAVTAIIAAASQRELKQLRQSVANHHFGAQHSADFWNEMLWHTFGTGHGQTQRGQPNDAAERC